MVVTGGETLGGGDTDESISVTEYDPPDYSDAFDDPDDNEPSVTSDSGSSSSTTTTTSTTSSSSDDDSVATPDVDDSDMGSNRTLTDPEDNALAAQLSSMTGGTTTSFGTTARQVLDTVSANPERFQSAVEGAREQYREFREEHPLDEIVSRATDNDPDTDPGDVGEGVRANIDDWASKYGGMVVAGAVGVVGLAAVLGGDS